jgi:hypothetical protein
MFTFICRDRTMLQTVLAHGLLVLVLSVGDGSICAVGFISRLRRRNQWFRSGEGTILPHF